MTIVKIIHPEDETTNFLITISSELTELLKDNITYLKIAPNKKSHIETLKDVEDSSNDTFFIFLGHGTHLSFAGARSSEFEKPYFILNDGLHVFKDKKLFAFSCKSADYFKEYSKTCNLHCSLGFGFVPTEMSEIEILKKSDRFYEEISIEILEEFKLIITRIISNCLSFSISNDYSFHQIYNDLNLRINKSMSDLILGKHIYGEILSNLLYLQKIKIGIFGKINVPISKVNFNY